MARLRAVHIHEITVRFSRIQCARSANNAIAVCYAHPWLRPQCCARYGSTRFVRPGSPSPVAYSGGWRACLTRMARRRSAGARWLAALRGTPAQACARRMELDPAASTVHHREVRPGVGHHCRYRSVAPNHRRILRPEPGGNHQRHIRSVGTNPLSAHPHRRCHADRPTVPGRWSNRRTSCTSWDTRSGYPTSPRTGP